MMRAFFSIFKSPPFLLLSFGVAFALLWHFSIIYMSPFSWLDNRLQVERLFITYLALHALLVLAVVVWAHSRFGGRWVAALIVGAYGILLAARALDWNILYYYGGHIDVLFWNNAFYSSSMGMLVTRVALLGTLSVIFGVVTVAYLMHRVLLHQAASSEQGVSLFRYLMAYCVLPPLVMLLLGGLWVNAFFSDESGSNVYTKYPPEYYFARSLQDFMGQGYAEQIDLGDVEKSKLASMGLPLEMVSTEYPLMKSSVYLDAAPNLASYAEPPNVILIMLESFSSYFMENPAMRELGLTENLNAFGNEALYFSNIINANTPTLQGQIATLASSLHVFKTSMNMDKRAGHADVDEQDHALEGSAMTRYPFVSILLREHGYESFHINGANANFADTEQYFRFSGKYDDFIAVEHSKYAELRKYDLSHWGARDIDTFNVAVNWLENRAGAPFLLSIASTDIHHPYNPIVSKPGVDDDLLNSVYSTDVGFGEFWEYFRQSKYKDNTIIIVTADHALFPTSEYLSVRGDDIGYYDNIPLMVYSPYHQSRMGKVDDTRGSQLDIAPTLFELLGLDSPNSFMGLSLLSDRKNYPYLFGKVNLETRTHADAKISWGNKEQSNLIKYIRYLSSLNKLYSPTESAPVPTGKTEAPAGTAATN